MFVKFNQAAHLKGKNGSGKDYLVGTHDVPDEHLQDPHFHRLMKAGLVQDGDDAKPVEAISLQERQKRLAEKLSAKAPSQGQIAGSPAGSQDGFEPSKSPLPVASAAPKEDSESEEAAEKAQKHKKQNKR